MPFQKIKLIFFLGIFIAFTSCNGQVAPDSDQQIEKDSLGKVVSNLPEAIWSIYQDQNNHYWYGSNGKGVYYFDGHKIKQFTKEDGLVGNQIRGIQGDKMGNIYFDTPEGIGKYNGQQLSTLTPIYSKNNEWKIKPDDLWFKGSGNINGAYRFDGTSLFFLTLPEKDLNAAFGLESNGLSFSPYGVYNIHKDKNGNLWLGTLCAGVYRFDGTSFLWIAEKELSTLEDGRVPGIRAIIEDRDGHFWLSNTLNRYRIIEQQSGAVSYKKLDGISAAKDNATINLPYFMSAILDDQTKDLWMLSYAEGVWRYDGEKLSQYNIKDGETDVLLYTMYKDNQGIIWLGTHNAGVYRFNGDHFEKAQISKKAFAKDQLFNIPDKPEDH